MNDAELTEQVLALMGRRVRTGHVVDAVGTAVRCIRGWFFIDDPATLKSYIDGIDLAKPVRRVDLIPPREFIAYRWSPERRFHRGHAFGAFGEFFTEVGTSKHNVGIGADDRRFVRYTLAWRTPALESTASTGFISGMGAVYGGGVQYMIPQAERVLRVTHIQHNVR